MRQPRLEGAVVGERTKLGDIAGPGRGLVAEARAWRYALAQSIVPVEGEVLAWARAAWESHVNEAGGDPVGGGCELVPVADLAEYLEVWVRWWGDRNLRLFPKR